MSKSSVAQHLFLVSPPSSVEAVVQQLESICIDQGIDVATVSNMRNVIYQKLDEYSAVLFLSPERVLQSLEAIREGGCPAGFYSEHRLPDIDDAYCWPTAKDFRASISIKGNTPVYICPKCNQGSSHESECTPIPIAGNSSPEKCGWILDATSDKLQKNIKVVVQSEFLDSLVVHHMFRPKGVALPARVLYDEFGEDGENEDW